MGVEIGVRREAGQAVWGPGGFLSSEQHKEGKRVLGMVHHPSAWGQKVQVPDLLFSHVSVEKGLQ